MLNTTGAALVSPWIDYYRQIEALFGEDPDITVEFDDSDDEDKTITLRVDGADKAEALGELLPDMIEFGNVSLEICITPSNKDKTKIDLFRDAFLGNPVFSFTYSDVRAGVPYNYMVFKKVVAQYFNDDLSDINGFKSTLYQDIAKNIFREHTDIRFCTDKEDA